MSCGRIIAAPLPHATALETNRPRLSSRRMRLPEMLQVSLVFSPCPCTRLRGADLTDPVPDLQKLMTWVQWLRGGNGSPEHVAHFEAVAIPQISRALLRRRFATGDGSRVAVRRRRGALDRSNLPRALHTPVASRSGIQRPGSIFLPRSRLLAHRVVRHHGVRPLYFIFPFRHDVSARVATRRRENRRSSIRPRTPALRRLAAPRPPPPSGSDTSARAPPSRARRAR